MSTMKEIQEMKDKYTAKIEAEGRKILAKEFKEFFKENTNVKKIVWTQYTPHFNDGSPCEFGVNEMYATANEDDDPHDLVNGGGDSPWSYKYYSDQGESGKAKYPFDPVRYKELEDVKKAVAKFETALHPNKNEDVFKAVFGDGVLVAATKDGFEVEEYDHD